MMDPMAHASALDFAVRQAERRRALHRWPAWRWQDLPAGAGPDATGWARDFTRIATNDVFAVMTRPLADGGLHAMISTLPGMNPPTWVEKQRIKDTLFGARWAVEAFPPRNALVDGADAFHLYVYPPDGKPPLDLKTT
jgi:hypothetical protein